MLLNNLFSFMCMPGNAEDFEGVAYNEMFLDNRVYNTAFKPKADYTRALQLAFIDALGEIDRLNHVINQSAHASMMEEAENIRQDYYKALKTIAELEAENEKKSLLLDFYKSAAEDNQNKLTVKDIMRMEQSGTIRASDGTIRTADGTDGEEKKCLCLAYSMQGWTSEELAERFKVSPASVKAYVSGMRKHCRIEQTTIEADGQTEHKKTLFFDQE